MSSQRIFNMVERLEKGLPLDPDKIGMIIGTKIVRDTHPDMHAMQSYTQSDKVKEGAYESVDLRMPDPDIGDRTLFLSVSLRRDEGVSMADICDRFGTEFYSSIPSPKIRPGQVPIYLSYEREWGTLSFGVTADEARKLVCFILSTRDANHAEG